MALKNAQDLLDLADQYPADIVTQQTSSLESDYPHILLTEAGAVSPHQLRAEILQHPSIELKIANITTFVSFENKVQLKVVMKLL